MENKIQKLYRTDCATMLIILTVFGILLAFITLNVVPLTSDVASKGLIMGAAALVAVFGTASSFAVLIHLKKSKRQIYVEDLCNGHKEKSVEKGQSFKKIGEETEVFV
ncbi:MAG: hypothetical protein JJE17_03900 [Peptostreptococcaceae bacterium]|nr:hypothetical protein [Peptostreptococcaceae bacterium]